MNRNQLYFIGILALAGVFALVASGFSNNTFLGDLSINVNTQTQTAPSPNNTSDLRIQNVITDPENFSQTTENVLFIATVNDRRGYSNIEEVKIDLRPLNGPILPMTLVYRTEDQFFIGEKDFTFYTQEAPLQKSSQTWFNETSSEAWFITQFSIPSSVSGGEYRLPVFAKNKQGEIRESFVSLTIGEIAQVNEAFQANITNTSENSSFTNVPITISPQAFVTSTHISPGKQSNAFVKVDFEAGLEKIQSIILDVSKLNIPNIELEAISGKAQKVSTWFIGRNITLPENTPPGSYSLPVNIFLIDGSIKESSTTLVIGESS